MEHTQRMLRKIPIEGLILGTMAFLVACVWIFSGLARQRFMEAGQAFVGNLYEKDSELCEELLREMFETKDASVLTEERQSGEQAMLAMGYTSKGMEYLYRQSGLSRMHGEAVGMAILAAVAVFLFLWLWKWRDLRREAYLSETIYRCRSKKERFSAEFSQLNKSGLSAAVSRLLEDLKQMEGRILQEQKRTQAFLENIAHQIKTPLSYIYISLDLLLEELREERQRKRVTESFAYLEEIETLIKRLLDIGRLESGKLKMKKSVFSPELLLRDCMDSLDWQGERFCFTSEKEAGAKQEYYGDYDWLKEAFSNILKNCLEHGTEKKVSVRLVQKAEAVLVTVRDFGEGIPEKDLPHIFDRFYQPQGEKASHTGIGLNLAKLVFERHFGVVEAANHEDGGAVFSILLPLYALK